MNLVLHDMKRLEKREISPFAPKMVHCDAKGAARSRFIRLLKILSALIAMDVLQIGRLRFRARHDVDRLTALAKPQAANQLHS